MKIRAHIVVITFIGLLLIFSATVPGQKVRLRSQITPSCQASGNANWKFADIHAEGGLAVQGSFNCRGAFIYDISDPDRPTLASWYNPGANQQFLEAVIVGNRGYFGSGNGGGVHIVSLVNPTAPVLLGIVNSSNGNGFGSIHEMLVIRQNGRDLLIANNNSTGEKRIRVVDVTNPGAAVFVRDIVPTEPVWVHAMHVRGDRMYTSGWGSSVNRARTEIYDIADLVGRPPLLLGYIEDSSSSVTAGNNMHSSWTSEDGRYLYSAREVTNSNGPSPGDVRVYDVADPAQPMLVYRLSMTDLGLNAITPHNPVVRGNKLYVSWYQAGVQVFDIGTPRSPRHIGQYDPFEAAFTPDSDAMSLADAPWDLICGTEALQNALPTSYDGTWAVFPDLGEDRVLLGDMAKGLLIVDVTGAGLPDRNRNADFDGDRKTDISVYDSSTGVWTIDRTGAGTVSTVQFGAGGDRPVGGDFDGDGKQDLAVYRPSSGMWFVLGSTAGFMAYQFGVSTDVPVPGDFDADGRTDFAVFRPSSGIWFVQQSTLGFKAVQWGSAEDKPVAGDYDGDGKTDMTVFRPSLGVWFIFRSSSSIPLGLQFGIPTDRPLAGDFDGDGLSDVAVYRPSSGTWWWLRTADFGVGGFPFGLPGDVPVPADYDGDGTTDVAVYRAESATWYRINSSDFGFSARQFGGLMSQPVPAVVNP